MAKANRKTSAGPGAKPRGKLTPSQLEVMEVLWAADGSGLKVAEIWRALSETREVARTTVLTTLQRLEKRGWLQRGDSDPVVRYQAVVGREAASGSLAAGFVDEFFEGSASRLVMSLLGSGRIKKAELARLRRLLDEEGA